jgi:tRNA(adenine34) deaminase
MDVHNNHKFFMSRCIELALIAKQRGESPVGSVIVKGGKVISHGIEGSKTHRDITFHAEIEAVRQAVEFLNSQDLSECIMYTTHEPCIMCSYVIRHAKISTVVTGISTGEIGGVSSKYPLLKDGAIKKWADPPNLIMGIMEDECRDLNK